ncbi:MAG: aspartate/glutamate racemase family protein, partial [Sedimentisphaerales bacterium]|nr:aspartate/glutamate racemase family protein [Sedimentisphaerales bacterium]
MKKNTITLLMLVLSLFLLSTCAKPSDPATRSNASSLVEIVKRGKSELFSVSFDRSAIKTNKLPIGVFDSGIGGLTVLEAILQLDAFNNTTHEPGADGRPDFEDERFIYLGDQANMPYGNYPSEQKTDFLRELIIKDVVFLLGERYWPSAAAQTPRYDKSPVKAIVIACNTATAYGLQSVNAALKQWRLPVRVIGIVEVGADGAVHAIAKRGVKGAIAVLATVGTCKSEGYIRAIEQKAKEAGILPPTVIQQGCLGLAGAVEGDSSYICSPEEAQTVDYRGPTVDNPIAPIDPELLTQYSFEPEGLLGNINQSSTWRLNSVENYIRYHTATLMESYRRSGNSQPIGAVILGCTHFPFYENEIAASFRRLHDFHQTNGMEPYENLILENPSFVDPAILTAKRLYETLMATDLLVEESNESALDVDEFYISVPDTSLAGVKLAETGGFTYEYKYGRDCGRFEWEYVKRVPMSNENLSNAIREKI